MKRKWQVTVIRLFTNQLTCRFIVQRFLFDPLNVFSGGSSVSEGHVNGEVQDKHDPGLNNSCSQEVLSHGSSEELLSDYMYEDLAVEIG